MIDRLMWLAGDIEEVLHAELLTGFERNIEAETVAAVIVRFAAGAVGTITGTTLAYAGMPQRVVICGTERSCAFAGDDLTYFNTKRPFEGETNGAALPPAPTADTAANPLSLGAQGHLGNIRAFASALRDQRAPLVTGRDARGFTRVLNMIYAKAGVANRLLSRD